MSKPDTVLMLVGDIYVCRDDPENAFRHVTGHFRQADMLFGNLEGVYSDEGVPWPKGDINVWKAGGRQIAAIEAGGFHAMAATNNHILDFGHEGMLGSLANLDRLGIAHAGAGRNFAEAHAPAIVERNGVRIALLAYNSLFVPGWEATPDRPGIAVIRVHTSYQPTFRVLEVPGDPPRIRTTPYEEDLAQLKADIEAAKRQADIVVCSFHWGISGGYEKLTEYQPTLGRFAVDAGADIVFGHHPHLLQGIEIYRGAPIFYSLGNFTFARHNPAKGQELESLIARCTIRDGRVDRIGFLPAVCDDTHSPHVVTGEDAETVLSKVAKRSAALNTAFEPEGDFYRVRLR